MKNEMSLAPVLHQIGRVCWSTVLSEDVAARVTHVSPQHALVNPAIHFHSFSNEHQMRFRTILSNSNPNHIGFYSSKCILTPLVMFPGEGA